jgi:hypothetical protein
MQLLSKHQTADRLGISVRSLDRMLAAGDGPPSVCLGRRRLFDPDRLDRWVWLKTA